MTRKPQTRCATPKTAAQPKPGPQPPKTYRFTDWAMI